MDRQKLVFSSCVGGLGLLCFGFSAAAVGIPYWGEWRNKVQSHERGHFGPWLLCKTHPYSGDICGEHISSFRPVIWVFIAGIAAAVSTAMVALFTFLSVLQVAMMIGKEKVLIKYKHAVLSKLVLSILALMLAVAAAGLFSAQTDEEGRGYTVTWGISFFLQIGVLVLNAVLLMMTAYEYTYSKRVGGDPTIFSRDPSGEFATTFGNPSFREAKQPGVAVTKSSGRPYTVNKVDTRKSNGHVGNGSVASISVASSNGSMNTLNTNVSMTSSIGSGRTPLRSSLKKPKAANGDGNGSGSPGIGIQNPGFAGTSPGAIKKHVRIQSHSTAV